MTTQPQSAHTRTQVGDRLQLTTECVFDCWHPNDPRMAVVRITNHQGDTYMAVVEPTTLTH